MHTRNRSLACALLLGALVPVLAHAQSGGPDDRIPQPTANLSLSGPRFGLTFLGGGLVDSLRNHHIKVNSMITQFGWQWEKQFLGQPGGIVAVSEWVLLAGGLDQGVFLPSATWLVGVRGPGGAEFGVGPNASVAGVGIALAAGITYRQGSLNVPFNAAIVPSAAGPRVSLLTGFTIR